MALLTPMTLAQARTIGEDYGLEVLAVDALAAGSVNSNFRFETRERGPVFVRVYEEQGVQGAARELELLCELQRIGVPTAAPLMRAGGGYVSVYGGKPVGVVPWIEGEILCFGRATPDVVLRLGRALAQVHVSSAKLSHVPSGRFGVQNLFYRLDAIDAATSAFAKDTAFIRQRLTRYAEAPSAHLPRGLIHGDLFRDNVLFRHGELVALIDFESASDGVFVYDLMVCVHAWCYGAGFDLERVGALLAGYSEVRALTPEEVAASRAQGALAALRFATTRISDFSLRAPPGQPPVRDFRRFLARLAALESGLLDPIIERGMS